MDRAVLDLQVKNNMITVVYSTRKENPEYQKKIGDSIGLLDFQILEYVNNGEYSLSEIYNKGLSESKNDIVIFCHDDLIFETNNWGRKITKHFNRNPEYGILGVAGTKYLDSNGKWWEVFNNMYGIVNHQHEGKKWTSSYSKDIGNKIEDVIIVDGLFIVVNKKNIKHKFDETIKGFHFYDLGFCLPNFIDGVKVGVIFDVRLTHLSIGQTNQEWENNRIEFATKYKENLPIDINDKTIAETFIFIHDQDLVIEYEKHNKFSNLYNYKYVFLGNRPTDKLSDFDNIIYAKNYDQNIEDCPLCTSYTGWYLLWKNNLITKKYVNLFEYDIILDKNIEQNLIKFYESDSEIIGYVPFPMNNYHFIKNPDWNEHILEAIRELHKIDLNIHFDRLLKDNPNALWSSTSNTTFRKDIFDEYMRWFEPIGERIKNTKTCGHAHERSVTYFVHIKRKKMLLANKLLKHLQVDSHKTQGHKVDVESNLNKLYNNIF